MTRVVIIKFGALGDVLRTTALLRPLARKYPGVDLTWVTQQEALPLLEGNPFIHHAFSHEAFPPEQRRLRFDLVVSMDEDPLACRFASSLTCREFIGAYQAPDGRLLYTPSSAAWFRMGLLNRDLDGSLRQANALKRRNRSSFVRIWMELLKLHGDAAPHETRPVLNLSEAEVRYAEQFARGQGLGTHEVVLGFNPGAGTRWPAKQLSPEHAAQIARRLHQELGVKILLFGGPAEHARNQRILELAGETVIDAGTHHSLREFAALVGLCHVLVTSDSLALHLGTALNRDVVAFFGPTSSQEVELFGRGVKLSPSKPCHCFYAPICRLSHPCLETVDPEEVVSAVSSFLRAKETCLPEVLRPGIECVAA